MTDTKELIERLREAAKPSDFRRRNMGLPDSSAMRAAWRSRAALEPFARCADELDGNADVPRAPDGEWAKFRLLTDDYRRARTLTGGKTDGEW